MKLFGKDLDKDVPIIAEIGVNHEGSIEDALNLITLAYKGKENRSDLLIFNAMDVASGPIATAHLPHRVPYGFHGNWRQGDQT